MKLAPGTKIYHTKARGSGTVLSLSDALDLTNWPDTLDLTHRPKFVRMIQKHYHEGRVLISWDGRTSYPPVFGYPLRHILSDVKFSILGIEVLCPECDQPFSFQDDYLCPSCRAEN